MVIFYGINLTWMIQKRQTKHLSKSFFSYNDGFELK
jgi:hypothetical protein